MNKNSIFVIALLCTTLSIFPSQRYSRSFGVFKKSKKPKEPEEHQVCLKLPREEDPLIQICGKALGHTDLRSWFKQKEESPCS